MKLYLNFKPVSGCSSARLKLMLVLVLSLPLAAAAQLTSSTNWLSLAGLLKKWEPVPLAEIQQAAEKGDASAEHYLGYCSVAGLRIPPNPGLGVTWYERALKNGYLPSANNLGLIYQNGLLGTNDMIKAVYYYTYAAEHGLAQSQANLGILYRDGKGLELNPVEAMRWFQRAAKQGNSGAMVEIGRLYRFGQGVVTNLPEAIKWFELASEKNDPLGMLNLGLLYEDDRQPEKAFQFYQQAADQGFAKAMTQLYISYWDGKGTASDHAKALAWLTKAAEANDPFAECLLGDRCEYPEWQGEGAGQYLPKPKLLEAFRWYRRSAEQNWAGGQYHLGLCYLKGKVVEQDEARGLELVRAAADKGIDEAVNELADLYARGIGEPRNDQDRPVLLLERCHDWEDLIMRYEHGLGTERDLVSAARCYCRGAMTGSRFYAQYSLEGKTDFNPPKRSWGTRMMDPTDRHVQILGPWEDTEVSDDVLRMLSLYLKSAKGDGQSALQIGNSYLDGINAPKSAIKAWAWFNLAAQNGAAQAHGQAASLELQMSGEELKVAREQLATLMADLKQITQYMAANF